LTSQSPVVCPLATFVIFSKFARFRSNTSLLKVLAIKIAKIRMYAHDLRNMIVEVFYFFQGDTSFGQFSVTAGTAH
jgi:hypothetical protein